MDEKEVARKILPAENNERTLEGHHRARRLNSSSIRNSDFATSPQVSAGFRDTRHSLANTDTKNLRASGGALNPRGLDLNFHRRQVAKGNSQVNTNDPKMQPRQGTANRDSSSVVFSHNEGLSTTINR